jgi:hypothetical protein
MIVVTFLFNGIDPISEHKLASGTLKHDREDQNERGPNDNQLHKIPNRPEYLLTLTL